ncbi:hypothetical protein EVAR_25457_1 [Eumeta japonica]|uniref:Uncharacterized protein n=1 Tax=Eumeta variegata TaxID=151549 RepID=A0A4C1VP39_EUMVA|nr:hypothetical protein EVAR_25457_1 [Eumeta japonica]
MLWRRVSGRAGARAPRQSDHTRYDRDAGRFLCSDVRNSSRSAAAAILTRRSSSTSHLPIGKRNRDVPKSRPAPHTPRSGAESAPPRPLRAPAARVPRRRIQYDCAVRACSETLNSIGIDSSLESSLLEPSSIVNISNSSFVSLIIRCVGSKALDEAGPLIGGKPRANWRGPRCARASGDRFGAAHSPQRPPNTNAPVRIDDICLNVGSYILEFRGRRYISCMLYIVPTGLYSVAPSSVLALPNTELGATTLQIHEPAQATHGAALADERCSAHKLIRSFRIHECARADGTAQAGRASARRLRRVSLADQIKIRMEKKNGHNQNPHPQSDGVDS